MVASEKGVVVGRLSFREDGDPIDCARMGVGGKAIPPNIDKVCWSRISPPPPGFINERSSGVCSLCSCWLDSIMGHSHAILTARVACACMHSLPLSTTRPVDVECSVMHLYTAWNKYGAFMQ